MPPDPASTHLGPSVSRKDKVFVLALLGGALFDAAYFTGLLGQQHLTALEQVGVQVGVVIGYLWGRR